MHAYMLHQCNRCNLVHRDGESMPRASLTACSDAATATSRTYLSSRRINYEH